MSMKIRRDDHAMIEPDKEHRNIVDFKSAVSRGDVDGAEYILVTGQNENTGTTLQTVSPEGGIYTFPSSAQTMTISSTDEDDTSSGTGAQVVFIDALDSNYDQLNLVATMDGTNPVTLSSDILRVNDIFLISSGSDNVNAGTICVGTGTVTSGVPAVGYGCIPIGLSVAMPGVYTIPNGKVFLFQRINYVTASNMLTEFALTLHFFAQDTTYTIKDVGLTSGAFTTDVSYLAARDSKMDITIQSKTSVSNTTTSFQLFGLLMDE